MLPENTIFYVKKEYYKLGGYKYRGKVYIGYGMSAVWNPKYAFTQESEKLFRRLDTFGLLDYLKDSGSINAYLNTKFLEEE